MAAAILTQARLKELMHYDPETGIFTWIASDNSATEKIGKQVGVIGYKGYVQVSLYRNSYRLHRLAWLYVHGKFPTSSIDHIDGNKANNRIANLREAKNSVNQQNLFVARKNNTSTGVLGVSKIKGRDDFRADIRVNKKKIYLGIFKTADEAHQAYLSAKRRLHEGCQI